jgi:hypothetical protein
MINDYVCVYTASGQAEAQLIVMLLESFNIPAEANQEGYGHALGLTVGALGAVDILVPNEYMTQAQNLLEAYARGDLESDQPDQGIDLSPDPEKTI